MGGRTFGINAAAWWGFNFGVNGPYGRGGLLPGDCGPAPATCSGKFTTSSTTGYVTGNPDREMTTVYEVISGANGQATYATPVFRFRYGAPGSIMVPCVNGKTSPILSFSPGVNVPCVNGFQNFTGYQYPGLITNHPTGTEDYTVANKWQVPINFHIGSMGLAPPAPNFVDSIPPMPYGGNLDDRRIGVGATMYYPVGVAGALLSMGDAHTAQGDSELDGTGIETSITGDFRITVIKAASITKTSNAFLLGPGGTGVINFPLLENANEYVVHGFTYPDYLNALGYTGTGCNTANTTGCPTNNIYSTSSVDLAASNTYHQAVSFLMNQGFTEYNAISALTVAADFGITQVVDGNWGTHYSIPKYILSPSTNTSMPYVQMTACKTSMPATVTLTAPSVTGGPLMSLNATAAPTVIFYPQRN